MAGKRHSISVFELMSSQAATGASTGVSSDATNNGVLSVVGYDQVAIQLGGGGSTYAATVNFQVTVDGATWLDKFAMSATDNALNDSVANDSGIHIVPVTGMSGFRLNLSAYTDGSITGFARATVGGGNLSFADIELSTALVTSDLADSDVRVFVETAADSSLLQGIMADTANRLHITETWNSTLQIEETTAVQDKTFSVPAGEDWHVMWIWVEYLSDANAGTRQIRVDVRDSADDVIMSFVPGATQIESLQRYYLFAPGNADLTAFRDTDYLSTPIPPTLILPELFDIRIYDQAVVTGGDTAGEDAIVQMMVMNRQRVST